MIQAIKKTTLREDLTALMGEHGFSQIDVGRAIKRSGTVLSQWFSGRYPGDVEDLESRIAGFIKLTRERDGLLPRQVPFIQTTNANIVLATARLSHRECDLGVITGYAGSGKTTSLEEYERQNTDVIRIVANLSFTPRVLFCRLCDALDLSKKGNINDLLERVVKKLSGTGRFIIIDQAEYLPHRALELLRAVYDDAKVGVLLAGMPRLHHNLKHDKGDFAQFYSRVAIHVQLKEPLKASEVEAMVKSRIAEECDHRAFAALCGGNARTLDKLIRRSKNLALNNETDINAEVVREAAALLMA